MLIPNTTRRVRKDLKVGGIYAGWVFREEVSKYLGKEVIIETSWEKEFYGWACRIAGEAGYVFTESMFEPEQPAVDDAETETEKEVERYLNFLPTDKMTDEEVCSAEEGFRMGWKRRGGDKT